MNASDKPYAIVGAGSVGLTLGARLAAGGRAVVFVTRSAAQARELSERGVEVEDVARSERRTQACRGVDSLAAASALDVRLLLLCTRAGATAELAPELARLFPGVPVAAVQNHVDNEALLARSVQRVLGVVFRQTCTRISAREVRVAGVTRLVAGAYPQGGGADVDELIAHLRAGGCNAGFSADVMADKWLKLGVNLMSVPNALVRREDHESERFVLGKVALLEEARAVFAAAGIVASSGDGQDRTLDQEIEFQRASLASGTSARKLPLYNQVWTAMRQGAEGKGDLGSLEADRYHALIVELGRTHGVDTPHNQRVLARLLEAFDARRGPESLTAEALFGER